MQQWLTVSYSFVCIQISPWLLNLLVQKSNETFTLNDGSRVNLKETKVYYNVSHFYLGLIKLINCYLWHAGVSGELIKFD